MITYLLVLMASGCVASPTTYVHFYRPATTTTTTTTPPPTTTTQSSVTEEVSRRYQHHHTYPIYNQNVYVTGIPTHTSGSSPYYSYSGTGYGNTGNLYSYPHQASSAVQQDKFHKDILLTTSTNRVKHKLKNSGKTVPKYPSGKGTKNPLGIVLGRPMASFDGTIFVPVYYPMSWATTGTDSYSNSFGSFYQTSASYPSYAFYNPPNTFYANMYESPKVFANIGHYEPKRGSVNSVVYRPREEMMHSDVTPDVNGNFKRVSLNRFLPAGSELNSFHETSNFEQETGDYYLEPAIKIRDPKEEYKLVLEANKEQLKAQERFEKEILMDDYGKVLPEVPEETETDMAEANQIPANDTTKSNNFTRKTHNSQLERLNKMGQTVKSFPVPSHSQTAELPVMTSIEIFDMPGANQYLGLADPIPTTSSTESDKWYPSRKPFSPPVTPQLIKPQV